MMAFFYWGKEKLDGDLRREKMARFKKPIGNLQSFPINSRHVFKNQLEPDCKIIWMGIDFMGEALDADPFPFHHFTRIGLGILVASSQKNMITLVFENPVSQIGLVNE